MSEEQIAGTTLVEEFPEGYARSPNWAVVRRIIEAGHQVMARRTSTGAFDYAIPDWFLPLRAACRDLPHHRAREVIDRSLVDAEVRDALLTVAERGQEAVAAFIKSRSW